MQSSSSSLPDASWCAHGFSPRKLLFASRFLGKPVLPAWLRPDRNVLVWGLRPAPARHNRITRVEDGFIRSSGLGVHWATPCSWVFDDLGMHYDPTRVSRVERLLCTSVWTPQQLARSEALLNRIRTREVSKYGLAAHQRWRPQCQDRPLVVAIGQVAGDAALHYASPHCPDNLTLLRRVRQLQPLAYLVYKPHPDTIYGGRQGGDQGASALCDEVVTDAGLDDIFRHANEVHVMSSLAGLEALIRGKRVICHGMPFYAGWGLTTDQTECSRRQRRLTLAQLAHAALIDYPIYWTPRQCHRASVEDVIDHLYGRT